MNMESHEVVAKVETLKSEGEADRTDELSGETLDASLCARLVEESGEAEDEEKKRTFDCPVCGKKYDKYQALGGHMNKHPQEKNELRIQHYERIRRKMNLRLFKTGNTREHMPETSSYLFNNIFQQPQQQVEHFQARQVPMDPQQLIWAQAPTNDVNFVGGPANYVTVMPNMPNPSSTHVPSGAAGYNGPPSMDPSLARLTSEQFNNLPTDRSTSTDAQYRYSAPPTLSGPRAMSSNAMYGYSVPCTGQCCNPLTLEPDQDPQVNIELVQNMSSTLDWDQPNFFDASQRANE